MGVSGKVLEVKKEIIEMYFMERIKEVENQINRIVKIYSGKVLALTGGTVSLSYTSWDNELIIRLDPYSENSIHELYRKEVREILEDLMVKISDKIAEIEQLKEKKEEKMQELLNA